ncbi:hypothetical protein J5N97_024756 [Dioscorea zingiberensis]|uniref:Protein kinase domain-containing protein n=1 Tax=Dioscorea zingiberensis TaxID=325984 RepID=A0A9D5C7I8_9LILI|nr:hypothetical protein J5N97_024756 [Dioscorea zingiberensis]
MAGVSSDDERSALLLLRDTLSSPLNLHSNWTGPPCYRGRSQWLGISCSSDSHVISIDLHSTQLTGSLSSSSFQNITFLSTINLSNNALNGQLPTLQGLLHLQSLAFAGNRFSGSIPVEYVDLKSLTQLEIQDNLLGGSIPPLDQPSLEVFNVSYNFLQGQIPQTSAMQRWNPKKEEERAKYSSGEQEEKKLKYGRTASKIAELEFINKDKPTFDLDDLLRASAEVMGKGKLGTTYRTTLESGTNVVVKRLIREIGGVSRKEFAQHIHILGKLKHENVVEIIAFYYSMDEKLLIFDHVPDDSLFHLLHENRGEGRVALRWGSRLNIVKGIARGLAYLHQSLPSHKVPHGNLKTSNVLILQPNHHPKLTDYGFLPLLQTINQNLVDKLAIAKTPEYSSHGEKGRKMITSQADVFCFGLILVEVVTGLVPSDEEDIGDLSEWVRSVVSNEWSTDILDLEIVAENESHEEMLKLLDFALECTSFDPERRPQVGELLGRIEDIRES